MSEVIELSPSVRSATNIGFLETATWNAISGVLHRLQTEPLWKIAVIVGAAGVGKTTAVREYERRYKVVVATLSPPYAKLRSGLALLATRLGVLPEHWSGRMSFNEVYPEIVDRLLELQGSQTRPGRLLIIVDEAQHAEDGLIDALRCIQDETEAGLALVGNPIVRSRLEKKGFEQVLSRVDKTLRLTAVEPGDLEVICRAYGIVGERARRQLETIAARSAGHLRAVKRVIMEARRHTPAGKGIDERAIAAAIETVS